MSSAIPVIPPTSQPYCTGCNRNFRTLSGFHSHLRQRRTDECCFALYSDYLSSLEAVSEFDYDYDTTNPNDLSNISMDIDCDDDNHNYNEDHLLAEESDMSDADADTDVDADAMDTCPEPERAEAPIDHPIPDASWDNNDDDGDGSRLGQNSSSHRRQAERILVDTGHGPRPQVTIRYSEKHRSSHAGSILNHANTHDDQYASTVKFNENIWAPFKSRLDWDLAQWAKMRGPGSTALSELLGIEGVSTE